jgi:hypothetical protein
VTTTSSTSKRLGRILESPATVDISDQHGQNATDDAMSAVTTTTAAEILEYRRPAGETGRGASAESKRKIDAAVQNRERAFQMSAWTMLAGGSAALLVLPLFAAGAAKIPHIASAHAVLAPVLGFASALALLVPALFWMERLTRGQWLDEEAEADGVGAPVPVAGAIELLLWGPRTVVAALRRRRQRVHANVLTEAASIIAYLRHFPEEDGVGTDELPTIRPQPVLAYLASRAWVGVSADGRRVWLRSDARRALGFDAR